MKRLLVIVTFLLPLQTAASQLTSTEFQYLNNKKELGAGLAFGILFPGGGHFYAGAPDMGLVFGLAEIGFTIFYLSEHRTNPDNTSARVALSLAGLAKLLDLVSTPSSVESYNEGLGRRIGITLSDRGIGVRITL